MVQDSEVLVTHLDLDISFALHSSFAMLWIRSVAVVTALFGYAFAKELVPNDILGAELYDSGIMMERIMLKKEVCCSH